MLAPRYELQPIDDEQILRGHESPSAISARPHEGSFVLARRYIDGELSDRELIDSLSLLFAQKTSPLTARYILELLTYFFDEKFFSPQGPRRAVDVARRHYDLGNDLFSAMLDDSMSYTCARWDDVHTLSQAQQQKLRLWCEKLQLAPGMHVLDIGCGWGNFAAYAASRCGVKVTGVTISAEQCQYARTRCKNMPVEIILGDYRDLHGQFDRVISVEMIEAVGKRHLGTFFQIAARCLKPGGLFGLQVITTDLFGQPTRRQVNELFLWVRKHIFPNGYVPSLTELTKASSTDFSLEHLENCGLDYEKTLLAWYENIRARWQSLPPDTYSLEFQRMWQFYLLSCAAIFRSQHCHLHHMLLQRKNS